MRPHGLTLRELAWMAAGRAELLGRALGLVKEEPEPLPYDPRRLQGIEIKTPRGR